MTSSARSAAASSRRLKQVRDLPATRSRSSGATTAAVPPGREPAAEAASESSRRAEREVLEVPRAALCNQRALTRADLEKYAEQVGGINMRVQGALDSNKPSRRQGGHGAVDRRWARIGTPSFSSRQAPAGRPAVRRVQDRDRHRRWPKPSKRYAHVVTAARRGISRSLASCFSARRSDPVTLTVSMGGTTLPVPIVAFSGRRSAR